MRGRAELAVQPHDPENDSEWNAFVEASPTGCLFQDLVFLGYHPPERFAFSHLEVRRDGALVAVLPGGVSEDNVFRSPLGASTGGPALAPRLSASDVIEIIQALQNYACRQAWRRVEITLPPPVTRNQPSQIIEFALHRCGFALVHRWMHLIISLAETQGSERYNQLFQSRRRSYVRANRRKGVVVGEHGIEALPYFLEVFAKTYERHDALPTHTSEEIRDLMQRWPERVRLWLATADDVTLAGVLLFHLNPRTAYTFYICDQSSYRDKHGMTALMASMIDALADRGIAYLDLGPSASDFHFNDGVVNFKEGIGARPFCRDQYSWSVSSMPDREKQ
jgi:hypothetical protein